MGQTWPRAKDGPVDKEMGKSNRKWKTVLDSGCLVAVLSFKVVMKTFRLEGNDRLYTPLKSVSSSSYQSSFDLGSLI